MNEALSPSLFRRLVALAGVCAAAACARGPAPAAEPSPSTRASAATASSGYRPKRLRVIGTNDFHGNLRTTIPEWAGGRQVGGAAVLAAYFDSLRESVDAPTVLIDGGDVMQGTPLSNLTWGRSTVEFYNRVGYTAVAFGNHEFDWGADTLAARVRQARFAWLGANIRVKGTDTLPAWSHPTHMVVLPGCGAGAPACDSVRVGIIGVVTESTPIAALPSNVAPFEFEDPARSIDRWVPRLREQGADFVIVAAHEGVRCATPPSEGCSGEMNGIASRLQNKPDLIVGGHTHAVVNVVTSGVPLVQGGQYGTQLTVVDLTRTSATDVTAQVRDQPTTFADAVTPDPQVAAMVARYATDIGPILDNVVATLAGPLVRRGGEYPLGNLIVDAQRHVTGATIGIMNNGGIRTDLLAGPVRYEDLFRVQPFANTLVLMDLSGEDLLEAIEHALDGGRASGHFSGVRVRFRPQGERGRRIESAALENGTPIDPDETYRVVVNNFLAEGGDGYTSLLEGRNLDHTGIVDLDALIDYLARLPTPVPLPAADRIQPVGPIP